MSKLLRPGLPMDSPSPLISRNGWSSGECRLEQAHEVSGRAVAMCEQRGIDLQDLSGEDLASLSPVLTVEMIQGLSVESALDARSGVGGNGTLSGGSATRSVACPDEGPEVRSG